MEGEVQRSGLKKTHTGEGKSSEEKNHVKKGGESCRCGVNKHTHGPQKKSRKNKPETFPGRKNRKKSKLLKKRLKKKTVRSLRKQHRTQGEKKKRA